MESFEIFHKSDLEIKRILKAINTLIDWWLYFFIWLNTQIINRNNVKSHHAKN